MEFNEDVSKALVIRGKIYDSCKGIDDSEMMIILCGLLGELFMRSGNCSCEKFTEMVADMIGSYAMSAKEVCNG